MLSSYLVPENQMPQLFHSFKEGIINASKEYSLHQTKILTNRKTPGFTLLDVKPGVFFITH